MERLNELFLVAHRHKGLIDGIQQDIFRIRDDLNRKEKELQQLQVLHANMDWCYRYLDALVKSESNRFIKQLEELLNFGVKTIFDDRDYSVEIVTEENNRASIHLKYMDEDGNMISPDVRDSVGGGIKTVIAILLNIFFLFQYGITKLLILDEALSQLSSEYLPNLFGLLDELAKKNGLKLLLITHDDRMTEYASQQYIVEDHKAKLVVKGE